MDCFIKKLFSGNADESAHKQFVRFGKGIYPGRAVAVLNKSDSKIKLKGSYEHANDFVNFASENCEAKFSGIITSKESLGLEGENKKAGLFAYEVSDISSSKIKEIADKAYVMLLDASSIGLEMKMKKKLPKPGKSAEAKIDDGFCVIEADLKYFLKAKDSFFWDIPDCKKAKAIHEYKITELVLPQGEKDFEKVRILTKRKGKIIRKLEIDGREEIKEKEFEA